MKLTLYVAAGVLLTLAGSMASGSLLLSALRLKMTRMEERLFALVAGAGLWSAIVFVLAWAHLARKGVFVALAAALIGLAIVGARGRTHEEAPPKGPPVLCWLFRAVFVFFLALYLVYAVAPEAGMTGNHLGRVQQFWKSHGFPPAIGGVDETRPSAIEFVYLPAFSFGRHPSAALVHLSFLVVLALGLVSYARRRGAAPAGVFAAVLAFASPLAGVDATAARTEAALACTLFFSFYALELSSGNKRWRTAVLAGVLLLFAVAIGVSPVTPGPPFQEIAARPEYVLGKAIVLTTTGATAQGFFGPVFLLSPLALLAARTSTGRRVLLAAALSALCIAASSRPEAALPLAVFAALALGLAVKDSPGAIPVLMAAHAVLSLTWVAPIYSWPDVWRLREWPWMAARHRVNEDVYLTMRMFPAYPWARAIERATERGDVVFALAEPARPYCSRRVIVASETPATRRLQELIETPLRGDWQATATLRWTFTPRTAEAFRVVAQAPARIHEVRLFHDGREVPRSPRWRVRGGEAFDNSYVTAWSSAAPGDAAEIKFDTGIAVDSVTVECPAAQNGASLEIWLLSGGHWERTSGNALSTPAAHRYGLRRAAIYGLKQRGFRVLFVPDSHLSARDMREGTLAWGVTPIGETHEAVIYRLD